MKRLYLLLVILRMLLPDTALAAQRERQTTNHNFATSQGWQTSAGTPASTTIQWNGKMEVIGRGGAGQFFELNHATPYQIAACTATTSDGDEWAGFGVTYYDQWWNEVHGAQKQIRRGDGNPIRQSLGIEYPADAVFAYVWVWNDCCSTTTVESLSVDNFFPEGFEFDAGAPPGDQYRITYPERRNLIENGDFGAARFFDFAAGQSFYEGHEFWNRQAADNAIVFEQVPGGLPFSAMRLGDPNSSALMYQIVPEVTGGGDYTFEVLGGRRQVFEAAPYAIAGIDFFDGSWNKLGAQTMVLDDVLRIGKLVSAPRQSRNLEAPPETSHAVVWVWVEALGDNQYADLWLSSVELRVREFETPVIGLFAVNDVEAEQNGNDVRFWITDNDRLDQSTLDNSDFFAIGPGGQRRELTYVIPNPFTGRPLTEKYRVNGLFTEADNGRWIVYYEAGEIADRTGNAALLPFPGAVSQYVAEFRVAITGE